MIRNDLRPAPVFDPDLDDTSFADTATDEALILAAAAQAYAYFTDDHLHARGLVRDSGRPGTPCSVGAAGFACAAHVAAELLGLADRATTLRHCLDVADAFARPHPEAGHKGLFYHFLNIDGPPHTRGSRAWQSELSTIDTALLMAGLLVAAGHFDRDDPHEQRLRELVNDVYDRCDWTFCLRGSGLISHGWRPEARDKPVKHHTGDGFIVHDWDGYSEGLLLYLLAVASDTHPVPPEAYDAWCATYLRDWQEVEGIEHLHCPPLFTHQFPHCFFDFRECRDAFGREYGIDYHENARRASLAHVAYADRNPRGHPGYTRDTWGISASNGPAIDHQKVLDRHGRKTRFYKYVERGLRPPDGVVDDGTLAPWAAAASLPFVPQDAVRAIRGHYRATICRPGWAGFMGSYNLLYVDDDCPYGWADEYDLGIEQAPIVIMAANHLRPGGGVWDAFWRHPVARRALKRCGFRGGRLG